MYGIERQEKILSLLSENVSISVNKLSSVQTVLNPIDAVFRAVSYRINTEAGPKGKSDFDFKLSTKDSAEVSRLLYGEDFFHAGL